MPIDWESYDMISVRVDMLGEDLVMSTFNNAVKYTARTSRLKRQIVGFEQVTMGDDKVCNLCDYRGAQIWRLNQMTPRFPTHIGCRCSMDVVLG